MVKTIFLEVIKLIKLWMKDPKIILGGIIAPLVILFAFYLMFGTLPPFKIGVINQDQGSYGDQLIRELQLTDNPAGSTYFEVLIQPDKELKKMFYQDRVVAVLTIPADFSNRVNRGNRPYLKYQINNYNTDFAKNLRLYLDEILINFYNNNYQDVKINIIEKYSAERFNWFKSISLGVIVLSFILGGIISAIYFYQKEIISNTIINYTLTPYPGIVFILPRYLLAFLIALISGSGTALAVYILNGSMPGISLIFAIALFGAIPYISLGLIVYKLIPRYLPAAIITMIIGIISWFLGGALGPTELMVSKLFPVYYTIDLLRNTLFYSDFSNFSRDLMILTVYSVIMFSLVLGLHRSVKKVG